MRNGVASAVITHSALLPDEEGCHHSQRWPVVLVEFATRANWSLTLAPFRCERISTASLAMSQWAFRQRVDYGNPDTSPDGNKRFCFLYPFGEYLITCMTTLLHYWHRNWHRNYERAIGYSNHNRLNMNLNVMPIVHHSKMLNLHHLKHGGTQRISGHH